MNYSIADHSLIKFKLLRVITTLCGSEKVRFLKLINALDEFYSDYDKLRVEARVRPSPEKLQKVNEAFNKYSALSEDIALSLTLAKILPDLT